jgi:hypothetical protein
MAQVPVEEEIKQKWGWLGHTLRQPHADVNWTALEWNPQGSRWRGRPNSTWRRSVQMEAKAVGLNGNGVKVAAKNKVRWRCVLDALCSKYDLQETLIDWLIDSMYCTKPISNNRTLYDYAILLLPFMYRMYQNNLPGCTMYFVSDHWSI